MSEEKYEYTEFPICPYCDYVDRDCWELSVNDGGLEGEGVTWCGACGKEIHFSRHIKTSYSTRKVKP